MRGGPSVWRRTDAVALIYRRRDEARITRLLCALDGIDPVAFEQEARDWEARCRREGAITRQDREALLAADLGITVAEVRAEVDEIVAQVEQLRTRGG